MTTFVASMRRFGGRVRSVDAAWLALALTFAVLAAAIPEQAAASAPSGSRPTPRRRAPIR